MLELILMRHAKTEPAAANAADRRRSLTSRGRVDADLAGQRLRHDKRLPDLVLCSPATRARQTLDVVVHAFQVSPKIEVIDSLYGGRADYFDILAEFGGTASRLMLIGHNPTIQATAQTAAASGERALRARLAEKFPTAAYAIIAFDVRSWPEVDGTDGRLLAFLTPADLGGGASD